MARRPPSRSSPATTSALMATHLATRSSRLQSARASPPRKWYFAISPKPLRYSRGGNVSRTSVSHSTAAGCHDDVAPGQAPSRELAAQVLDGLEVLGRLSFAHHEDALVDARVDLDADALLGHDSGAGGADGHDLQEPVARPSSDEHVVGAVAQGHRDGDHETALMIPSTTSSGVSPSTSRTTSATSV